MCVCVYELLFFCLFFPPSAPTGVQWFKANHYKHTTLNVSFLWFAKSVSQFTYIKGKLTATIDMYIHPFMCVSCMHIAYYCRKVFDFDTNSIAESKSKSVWYIKTNVIVFGVFTIKCVVTACALYLWPKAHFTFVLFY